MTSFPLSFPKQYEGDEGAAQSPLSYAHFTELELAQKRAKKIRRATLVAQTDAWLTAIFAGLTLLSGIFSFVALLLGLALAFCAYNSFRGAKQLKQLNPAAPKLLALNQLLLAVTIILYAAWSIYQASHANSLFDGAATSDPALANMLAPFEHIAWIISVAIYGGLIAGTILAQGSAALYYYTRKKHINDYVTATPAWILALQKAQLGG